MKKILLLMIICFPLLCGCEMESEYEEEKYKMPDENIFGQDLSSYENKDEFDIDKYSYDILDLYREELDECIDEKVDSKFIDSYVEEILEHRNDEDEIYDILNDYKDQIRIVIEKECAVQK